MTFEGQPQANDEELARAQLYGLLATLLSAPVTADILDILGGVEGDQTPLGQQVSALGVVSRASDVASIEDEFNALFVGLARGELLPYGSWYQTGFLHEKPLALLRSDLSRFGIESNEESSEPEDHIAILCEVMAGLIDGRFGQVVSIEDQKVFFDTHMSKWVAKFFDDLTVAKSARFYRVVGALGRAFMGVEAEAFAMVE